MGLSCGQQGGEVGPRVKPSLEGPTLGGEEPTTLLLRDAECRMTAVQDGALRADAALAQHLALLWVQWAQQSVLARRRRLTGQHTGLVGGVAGAQEGCRGTVGRGQGEEGPRGTSCDSADSAEGSLPLSCRSGPANEVLWKHSHVL